MGVRCGEGCSYDPIDLAMPDHIIDLATFFWIKLFTRNIKIVIESA